MRRGDGGTTKQAAQIVSVVQVCQHYGSRCSFCTLQVRCHVSFLLKCIPSAEAVPSAGAPRSSPVRMAARAD